MKDYVRQEIEWLHCLQSDIEAAHHIEDELMQCIIQRLARATMYHEYEELAECAAMYVRYLDEIGDVVRWYS